MITPIHEKPLVVVTGCSGLIGARLMEALAPDYRVIGLDIVEPRTLPDDATFMMCDLTDDKSVEDVLARIRGEFGDQLASVVHLAAYYDFSGEPSPMYDKLTVQGTRRLITGLQAFEKVEQLIFSSSLLAMKPVEETDQKLTEESPTQGEWDYPRSKIEAERVLEEHQGRVPVVVLRVAGVYDEQGHSPPLTQHIRRIYEKQLESYLFPGDPTHGQAFVHLDDLIECLRLTVDRRHELNHRELFLIAEPELLSHEQLQDAIGELLHGRQWPTIRIPKAAAKVGAWAKDALSSEDAFIKPWMIDLADDHYPVAIERARERLGWRPQHRLRDTLPAMIDNLQQDPRHWYQINKLPLPRHLREHEAEQEPESRKPES